MVCIRELRARAAASSRSAAVMPASSPNPNPNAEAVAAVPVPSARPFFRAAEVLADADPAVAAAESDAGRLCSCLTVPVAEVFALELAVALGDCAAVCEADRTGRSGM